MPRKNVILANKAVYFVLLIIVVYFERHKAPTMKHILYSALLFCFVVFISCEENEAGGPRIEPNKPASLPVVAPATIPPNASPIPVNNNVVTNTATAKLNPAHGQPGHKCEVAVGAPLPAGPVPNPKTTAPASPVINPALQTTPTLQTNPSAPVVTPSALAAGINPAHGQPGHRCDVAVGAAIPKTAASTVKTPTPNSPLIAPPVQNTPLIQPQPQASTAVTAGLNPAHGQPGHRCDVAVGKPLNSAPKKD